MPRRPWPRFVHPLLLRREPWAVRP
jgi:hypothetical protein